MRSVFWMGLSLGIAGCAPGGPMGGGEAPARGEASFLVSTAAMAPSGVNLEVRGVACVAEGAGVQQAFRSPARVTVPSGAGVEPVRVRCSGGGRSGEAVSVPWVGRGQGGGIAAYPSIGVGIGSGGDVGIGVGINTWPTATAGPVEARYPDLRVTLR